MDSNPQLTLKFGDGSPIWFALHERVTNLPLLAQLIQKHQGSLVSNIGEADFCLLSACRPDAKEAAARVVEEGGMAIDASWIWESNALGRLLPWYPYQLGKTNKHPDMSDEMRDTHELSMCLARYLPIVASVDSIYTHLAMKLPHRKAIQFKELHEQHKQAVDACVLHLANQIENVTPPIGYFNDYNTEMTGGQAQTQPSTLLETAHPPPSDSPASSTALSANSTSLTFKPAIPKTNNTQVMNNDAGHQQKSASFPSGTAAEPPSNGGDSDGNGVDLVPVQFPIEEQDDNMVTRISAGSVLPRLTAIPDQTRRSNVGSISTQGDAGKDKENPGPSGSSAVHTEISGQTPNELFIPPHNRLIPPTTLATKPKAGPPQKVNNAGIGTDSAVSESHLEGLKRKKRDPVPNLRDAMDQDETEDEGEESGDGDYVPHNARIRPRDMDDSDEEQRPKRRKKNKAKDKGSDKARDKGERRSRTATVPQHQIDAMLQWGLNHPMEQGENQKVYWSKFVEQSHIGKERTWASWEAVSRHHGRPPVLNRSEPVQNPASITVDPNPQVPRNATSIPRIALPPAQGKNNSAEIRSPGSHQVKSAQSHPPLPDMGVTASPPHAVPPNKSHIMRRNTDVNTTTATSSKPPANLPQIGRYVPEGNTVETDKSPNSYRSPAVTGAWPYSSPQRQNGLQPSGKVPTKVGGGFTHSIRAPALFKDMYGFADRLAQGPFHEQLGSRRQLPDDSIPRSRWSRINLAKETPQ